MGLTATRTCDACGASIDKTFPDGYLKLSQHGAALRIAHFMDEEKIVRPPWSKIAPPVPQGMIGADFCSWVCLSDWLEEHLLSEDTSPAADVG